MQKIRLLSLLLVLHCQATLNAQSSSWPQFLGPDRNGVSKTSGLMSTWPAQGPPVLWRTKGGVGMSGVAVSDQHAITMWNTDSQQVVAALSTVDGHLVWSTPVADNYENSMGHGPRATPAISGDRVFAYSGDGVLACLNLSDGKLQWTKDVVGDVGGKVSEYGMSSSPLIVDDLVIVTAGGKGSALVALDCSSGAVRWSAIDGTAGYSSPALLEIAGEPQVVAFTGFGLSGVKPDDGTLLWQYPFKTPFDCNTATPISVGGKVFISAGENHGCAMLEVSRRDEGYRVDEVWTSLQVKSVMRNEWQTSALLGDYLYGFDNVGSAGPVTHLTCVNARTGETLWRENRYGKANLVAADGKLWITNMEGEFIVARADPQRYVELGRIKLFGRTRQAPSIAGGKAYVRDDAEVVCIKID